jgi:hypothetical protein
MHKVDEPSLAIPAKPSRARIGDFDRLVEEWKSLTYVLNKLTRRENTNAVHHHQTETCATYSRSVHRSNVILL